MLRAPMRTRRREISRLYEVTPCGLRVAKAWSQLARLTKAWSQLAQLTKAWSQLARQTLEAAR